MKHIKIVILYIAAVLLFFGPTSCGTKSRAIEEKSYESITYLRTSDVKIRDPFVLVDQKGETYYVPASNAGKGFKMYKSKDLKNWQDLGVCFEPEADFWGKSDFWAPDLYKYNGKYYIFGTFSGTDGIRGTSVLVADNVEGPYKPLVNKPTTPADWMALDGALYIDKDDQSWMLYCHEWLQVDDGEMVAHKLSADLRETVGEPIILFKASDAPWTVPSVNDGKDTYVTDAPVVYSTPKGNLVMLWSSFGADNRYHVATSYSKGGLLGPWEHEKEPLNTDDGGHSMLFTDLEGGLKISYHSPNSKIETFTIKDVYFDGNDKLQIRY